MRHVVTNERATRWDDVLGDEKRVQNNVGTKALKRSREGENREESESRVNKG